MPYCSFGFAPKAKIRSEILLQYLRMMNGEEKLKFLKNQVAILFFLLSKRPFCFLFRKNCPSLELISFFLDKRELDKSSIQSFFSATDQFFCKKNWRYIIFSSISTTLYFDNTLTILALYLLIFSFKVFLNLDTTMTTDKSTKTLHHRLQS